MLGLIEDDLKDAIGVNVTSVNPKNTIFGFQNEDWKEYSLDNGLEVLVSKHFNTTKDADGNTYIYPEGDMTVNPSGKMPKNGYYFDGIVRQEEIDDDNLDPEDNLKEFKPVTDEDIAYFKHAIEKEAATGLGLMVNFGGTGLGDVALVPAPFLKHPKGIRDIAEWYMATAIRKEYLHAIFDKQTDVAVANLEKLNKAAGSHIDAVFICGTYFGTQTGIFCSLNTFNELYMPYYKKINNWIHENTNWKTFKHCCGAIECLIPLFIESGFDILNPVQCSAAGMEPRNLKEKYVLCLKTMR